MSDEKDAVQPNERANSSPQAVELVEVAAESPAGEGGSGDSEIPKRRGQYRRYVQQKTVSLDGVTRTALRALMNIINDIDLKREKTQVDRDFVLAAARDLSRVRNDKARADTEAAVLKGDDAEAKSKKPKKE